MWAAIWPLLVATFGAEAASGVVKTLWKSAYPVSDSEKALFEMQQQGIRQNDERSSKAMNLLMQENADADFRKLLMNVGAGNIERQKMAADEAAKLKAQGQLLADQAGGAMAAEPGMLRLSTLMNSPTNFKTLLGLE